MWWVKILSISARKDPENASWFNTCFGPVLRMPSMRKIDDFRTEIISSKQANKKYGER
jgi:hypothetical protein